MKAVQFKLTIPRYALGLSLGKLFPSILWNGLSCISIQDVPEPQLLGPEWVKIKTELGGICGTDMSTVTLKTSTYYDPFSSSPFTFGHENVGRIVEVGAGVGEWQVGQRVVANPYLWCAPRGYAREDWCEHCVRGETNRCLRYTDGALSPALSIGTSPETGGSWSRTFVAHKSMLHAVPENVSVENALMVEPFACGLHAALMDIPADDETVLIIGAGTIGLVQLAALRALGCKAPILITTRYPFQAEAARRLGADEIISGDDVFEQVAELTAARIFKPIVGKRVVLGGAHHTYECTGSPSALDDALRLTRNGGTVMMVGLTGVVKDLDWTAIFQQELTVHGSVIYNHAEQYQGETRNTFDLTLQLMAEGVVDVGWLVSRRYPLTEYKRALAEQGNKRQHPIVKAVFEFPE